MQDEVKCSNAPLAQGAEMQLHYRFSVLEFKTRHYDSVPTERNKLAAKMQVMMYQTLLLKLLYITRQGDLFCQSHLKEVVRSP